MPMVRLWGCFLSKRKSSAILTLGVRDVKLILECNPLWSHSTHDIRVISGPKKV